MEVRLVGKSTDTVKVVSAATRATRANKPMDEFLADWDSPGGMDREAFIHNVLRMGHEGIAEFAWYVFSISGISRVATHQLVRHRMASYLQMSSRHTNLSCEEIKTPPEIERNNEAAAIFQNVRKTVTDAYNGMLDLGIKPEDARFVIPDGVTTHIAVGMNGREIRHFLKLRLCYEAQWEIRQLAEKMLELVRESEPCLFLDAEIPCISGDCANAKCSSGFVNSMDYKKRKSEYTSRIENFERMHGSDDK